MVKKILLWGLAVVAVAAFGAFLVVRQGKAGAPGPLHQAHAALGLECSRCHDEHAHVDDGLCLGCHTDPQQVEVAAIEGFARHQTYAKLACSDCHLEHLGAEANLLRGGHGITDVPCSRCHERHTGARLAYFTQSDSHPRGTLHAAHARWEGDCFTCHVEDLGAPSERCTRCHDPKTGEKVCFEGFANHHTDRGLRCLECHTEHRGRNGDLTRPDHAIAKGECARCHKGHVGPDFAYATHTSHPKDTLHRHHALWQGDCGVCHSEGGGTPSERCTVCHEPETDKPVRFDGFAAHHVDKTLDCLECHVEHHGPEAATTKASHTINRGECTVCHERHVGPDFAYPTRLTHPENTIHATHVRWGQDCSTCHAEGGGTPSKLCAECHEPNADGTNPFVGFAAHHTWADLDCIDCHLEHRSADGNLTRPGHAITDGECGTCHARHVGADFAYPVRKTHPEKSLHADHAKWQRECTACHAKTGGTPSNQCVVCHEPGTNHPVTFRGFAAHHTYADLDCLDCHLEHRGRDGAILRPGKSIQTAGCKTCHERHVGPYHTYALAADRHPEAALHPSHERWVADCASCHAPGTGRTQCTSCHDPGTGERVVIEGFAAHHFREDLKCLDCHTEHRGHDEGATLKPGITFGSTDCLACHKAQLEKPSPLAKLPVAVRGDAAVFLHSEHPRDRVGCAECHPMRPKKAHDLASPYRAHCGDCHHGPEQELGCAHCHQETADLRAGKIGGKLVPRGTHARSGEVACKDCHRYQPTAWRFDPPEATCVACHPKGYTDVFLAAQRDWAAWRKGLGAGDDTKALRFLARNWYHNDAHATAARKRADAKP